MGRGYIVPLLPEEFDSLYDEDVLRVDRDIYLFMRNWMDRDSAIAGYRSRISYRGIYERIFQAPRAGFAGDDFGANPANYVRNCIRRMISKGWLINRSSGQRLAVEFKIYAKYRNDYSFAQNKVTTNLPPQDTTLDYSSNTNNNSKLDGLSPDNDEEVTTNLPQKVTTYPNILSINQSTPVDKFLMSLDWKPSVEFEQLAKLSMLDIQGRDKQVFGEAHADLLMFWTSPETLANPKYAKSIARTQIDWERRLLTDMQQRKAGMFSRSSGGFSASSGGGLALPRQDVDLPAFASRHGLRAARAGESFADYRRELTGLLRDMRVH